MSARPSVLQRIWRAIELSAQSEYPVFSTSCPSAGLAADLLRLEDANRSDRTIPEWRQS